METKSQKQYPRDYNSLRAHDLWQGHYQIWKFANNLAKGIHKIKCKCGDTMIKNLKLAELTLIFRNTPSRCWFSRHNSETVKAVTLAFCSLQLHFIRNIRVKFGIPNSP